MLKPAGCQQANSYLILGKGEILRSVPGYPEPAMKSWNDLSVWVRVCVSAEPAVSALCQKKHIFIFFKPPMMLSEEEKL